MSFDMSARFLFGFLLANLGVELNEDCDESSKSLDCNDDDDTEFARLDSFAVCKLFEACADIDVLELEFEQVLRISWSILHACVGVW